MVQYRITLILDDGVAAQATLLTEIQNTLASIAGNLPVNPQPTITVQRIS